MTEKLIGRERECAELQRCMTSDRSELVIIYGRRRIGKTFLVEHYFEKRFDFWYVGAHGMSTKDQLRAFAKTLKNYSGAPNYQFANWIDAFDALKEYLSSLSPDKKRLVFIDEMPWMDTGRSNFVVALENFWNGWAMSQENVVLVATGSATSWMRDKVVGNKGGLHARVTCQLHLRPFSLHEVEALLARLGMEWSRYDILKAYMLLGGVPYYYSIFDPRLSLDQNIDLLCFMEDGKLRIEFEELFNALFVNADYYIEVTQLLSECKGGLSYNDIAKKVKMNGTQLSCVLKNLERCDFVERWSQYGNKKKGEVFRLIDFYTKFYYKFVASNNCKDEQWWSKNSRSALPWLGNCFELVCLSHHRQIKAALGIAGVSTAVSAWNHRPNEDNPHGGQIDMIIDRADRIVHLCEMKFSEGVFHITADYDRQLRERMGLFQYVTGCKKTIVHTFITTYGVASGKYKGIVHSEVKIDDLFHP